MPLCSIIFANLVSCFPCPVSPSLAPSCWTTACQASLETNGHRGESPAAPIATDLLALIFRFPFYLPSSRLGFKNKPDLPFPACPFGLQLQPFVYVQSRLRVVAHCMLSQRSALPHAESCFLGVHLPQTCPCLPAPTRKAMAPSAGILGAVLLLVQSLAGPGAIERTSSWIDTDSDDTGLPPMPHAPPEDDPSRDARDDEDSDEAEQEVFDIPVLRHGDAPVLPEPQPAQGERPPRGRRQPEELANPKPTTRNYTPGEPSQQVSIPDPGQPALLRRPRGPAPDRQLHDPEVPARNPTSHAQEGSNDSPSPEVDLRPERDDRPHNFDFLRPSREQDLLSSENVARKSRSMHVGQKYRQEKNKDVKESANDVAPATFGTWTTTSPSSAPRVIASLAKTAKPACLRTNARNAKPSCTPMSETDVSTRETHRSIEQQMQHYQRQRPLCPWHRPLWPTRNRTLSEDVNRIRDLCPSPTR